MEGKPRKIYALFVSRKMNSWKLFSPLSHVWCTKENWSKETQFWSKENKSLYARKVFSFPYSNENTFLSLQQNVHSPKIQQILKLSFSPK